MKDLSQTILGPILNPRSDGSVDFFADGALACDSLGTITYIGPRETAPPTLSPSRKSQGIVLPPFLDAHIHIPQHPIRGRFMDGVGANPENGRLLAGLNRNVFPAEAKCADSAIAEQVIRDFEWDTLTQGVVGGSAYMTIHSDATDIALSTLNEFWHVGLVLMEMNCPEYLRVDRDTIEYKMRQLADQFGQRYIVTDRFAVAVDSSLRQMAVQVARDFGLRMQTHLNEQIREKEFVEKQLYPHAKNYTDVYQRDGLLDRRPILAHCVHMRDDEWHLLQRSGGMVAHCPTSNTLLCSGIMPLDELKSRNIPYAICTDVGASPTTSMLAEMSQFLKIHATGSKYATPQEALFRATLAPAQLLGLSDRLGEFEVGKPMSFIEVSTPGEHFTEADDAILRGLLEFSVDARVFEAFDRLKECTLDVGPQLDVLEKDVRDTAARIEAKRISVTLAGEKVV